MRTHMFALFISVYLHLDICLTQKKLIELELGGTQILFILKFNFF